MLTLKQKLFIKDMRALQAKYPIEKRNSLQEIYLFVKEMSDGKIDEEREFLKYF